MGRSSKLYFSPTFWIGKRSGWHLMTHEKCGKPVMRYYWPERSYD